jgi:hypothetical protein
MAWGRRRSDANQLLLIPPPAPYPTSSNQVSSENQDGGAGGDPVMERDPFFSSAPYPFLFVYETREQALAEIERRRRCRENFVIPPLPS